MDGRLSFQRVAPHTADVEALVEPIAVVCEGGWHARGVASSIYRSRPPQVSPQMRMLLSLVADQANSGESDLLSYLYFDREYTNVLLEMGYEHARAREEVIAHFLLRGEPEVHKLAG